MAKDAMLNPYHAFRSSLLATMLENPSPPLIAASGGLRRLFIHGADDKWCPVSEVRQAIAAFARSTLRVFEGVGHNTVVLEPARTAAEIVDFAGALGRSS
jgi:pimeloyl-ACP methyl ester carboxylesterase